MPPQGILRWRDLSQELKDRKRPMFPGRSGGRRNGSGRGNSSAKALGPWSGAEVQVPEDPRQPMWLEFMVKGKSGRKDSSGSGNSALCVCICQGEEETPWMVGFLHLLEAPGP